MPITRAGEVNCRACQSHYIDCDQHRSGRSQFPDFGQNGLDGEHIISTPSAAHDVVQQPGPLRIIQASFPGKDPNELILYQYFVTEVATSLAGSICPEFWLTEIAQFSLQEPVVWHALIALGSLHQGYRFKSSQFNSHNVLALQQMNASIQALTRPFTGSKYDHFRALVASVLFACISIMRGSMEQAVKHCRSGIVLFREFELDEARHHKTSRSRTFPLPIPLSSLRSFLVAFQLHNRVQVDADATLPIIEPQFDFHSIWKSFSAPARLSTPGNGLTPANLALAIRAGESLLFGLALFSQEHVEELKAMYKSGKVQSPSLARKQQLHSHCFKEIGRAIEMFEAAIPSSVGKGAWSLAVRQQMQKALLVLRIYHQAASLVLHKDPDEPNPILRLKKMAAMSQIIVELSEEVLALEMAGYGRGDGTYTIPYPGLMHPIGAVVQYGFGYGTRRRAVALLRQPRLEGLSETLMAASAYEAVIERELEAAGASAKKPFTEAVVQSLGIEEISNSAYPLLRVCRSGYTVDDRKERTATAIQQTWEEVIHGIPGKITRISW